MSRMNSGEPIPVKAGLNVYTALAFLGVLVTGLCVAVLFMKYNATFTGWPFTMQ